MFTVLDFETTGLSYKNNAVIEIGAIKLDGNLKSYAEFSTKVRLPEGVALPDFITGLTGITEDDLKDAPTADRAFGELRSFLNDSIIVAHNASFDLGFLHKYLPDHLPNFICTRYLSRTLEPRYSASLADCVQRHHIVYEGHHRALKDCEMTAKLLKVYRGMAYKKNGQGNQSLMDHMNILVASDERPISYLPKNARIIIE